MIPLSFSEIKKKYKNICFLSFDPQYQKQIDMLLLFFSAAGFNAFIAADFDGLMGKYFNYRLSYGDPTDPKIELREDLMRHEALLKEKGVPIEETDESDTLFVLLNSIRLHSINEEVQISLWKLGLEKECASINAPDLFYPMWNTMLRGIAILNAKAVPITAILSPSRYSELSILLLKY